MHPDEVLDIARNGTRPMIEHFRSQPFPAPRYRAKAVGVARCKVYRTPSIDDSFVCVHLCQLPRDITPIPVKDLLVSQCSISGGKAPALLQE